MTLFAAGVDFEDNRIPRSAWPALKPTTPFGGLPIFEVPGKPALSQSNTILGHIGRSYGLLPTDEWEALRLESLLSTVEDLRHAVGRTFGIEDAQELKRKRTELVEGPIATWAASMEKQIVGPFAGGAELSVADIKLFVVLGWLTSGVLDHVPTDVLARFPKLMQVHENVKQHPRIAAWYARRPPPAQSS